MNKKYLKLSVIILTLVIAMSVFSKPIFAAAEKVTSVMVSNWPSIFNTREQNLDQNGNIKVAQQGSVDVKLINISPIPVNIQTGSLRPKTLTVFDGTINQGQEIQSDEINLEDYKKATLFVRVHIPKDDNNCNNAHFSINPFSVVGGDQYQIDFVGTGFSASLLPQHGSLTKAVSTPNVVFKAKYEVGTESCFSSYPANIPFKAYLYLTPQE